MNSSIESAEQRLANARAELAGAQEACERAEQRHREDVTAGARPSEVTRSESAWLEAQRAVRRAQWTVEAREVELRDAETAHAAAVEVERVAALSAAWACRDEAGEKINGLIAALTKAAADFDAAAAAILDHTPASERGAQRELLFHQAQRFVPALVQAIAPDPGRVSGLVKAVGNFRPLWNDRLQGIFYGKKHRQIFSTEQETAHHG